MDFLAQVAPPDSFWHKASGTGQLYGYIIGGLLVGLAITAFLMFMPTQARRPVVIGITFLSGLFYVMLYYWPSPIGRDPGTLPGDLPDRVGFWLADAQPTIGDFANVLTAFLLGLGIYSVLRIHTKRLFKMQTDWFFSAVLLLFMVLMVFFGYWNWRDRLGAGGTLLEVPTNWALNNMISDLLFDGMFQAMNAAMFSIIAFYILSAAYRAFRVRSIEATILLAAALVMMLSLLGTVASAWDQAASSHHNLSLTVMAGWLRDTVQNSSLRGIDFGIGIGALAMGLRLWLSLEKTGAGT